MGDFLNSRLGVAVAVLLGIGVVAFFAIKGDDEKKPAAQQAPNPPVPVSAAELASASKSLGQPIYWAGDRGATKYELTRTGNERIAVRYLVDGSDASQGSLTVATYKLDDPVAAIRRAGQAPTAKLHRLKGGGLAVSDTSRPTNAYVAYPKQPYQVEVFDPKPGRALKLVLDGQVRPV